MQNKQTLIYTSMYVLVFCKVNVPCMMIARTVILKLDMLDSIFAIVGKYSLIQLKKYVFEFEFDKLHHTGCSFET